MSGFFGSVLTDRSGKFNRQDDFANLEISEGHASYDFEDTYDGLGDQLEEDGDDMNEDTFGTTNIGRDFDFSGKTAHVADTLHEEQLTFQRTDSQRQPQIIDRSIQSHQNHGRSSNIAAATSSPWNTTRAISGGSNIWGQSAPQSLPASATYDQIKSSDISRQPAQVPPRKYQTLEEVEAAMRASAQAPPVSQVPVASYAAFSEVPSQQTQNTINPLTGPPGYRVDHTHDHAPGELNSAPPGMYRLPMPAGNYAWETKQTSAQMHHERSMPQFTTPITISREDGPPALVDEATLRIQQQKNLRRAQKIGQMAKYNGIMSNGDKNYVLKVQISQLVSEDPEADDFYYTVHSTLRGRSHVQQSLGHFQQTYLNRTGQNNRRGNREKQNPMLKMQQQVQKIIASAKSKPKSTSLAVEGSLGKLSFSRVRQPKQVLNVKMPESSGLQSKQSKIEALQSIEVVYNKLLLLEQTGRQIPPESADEPSQQAWNDKMSELADEIWKALHIMETVDNSQLHPFIQLLQYGKGMKLIPRLYRNLNPERRLTMMTMIVAHLDMLDVVRQARYDEGGNLPKDVRDGIDLFSQTVLPPLLVFASNASMKIVVGLLNMLLERNHIQLICMSKVGLSFMTMFISRAEIIKQADQADDEEISSWQSLYNRMFSNMEGKFAYIFPPPSHHVDEIYPWQFLAACAVSASPDQQHSLVNEARDRVLDNVQATKSLPRELADTKRSNVNLFLNAIGLDASQLEA